MVPDPEVDKALAEQMGKGNPDAARDAAFWQWAIFGPDMIRTRVARCIKQPVDSAVVEEIAEEAFASAYKAVLNGKFEYHGKPFTAFVIRIALNKLNDRRRRREPLEYICLDDAAEIEGCEDDAFERFERREEIFSRLRRLSARRRDILIRTIVYDQSYAEIAASLGISEDLVRQEKSRGLRDARR